MGRILIPSHGTNVPHYFFFQIFFVMKRIRNLTLALSLSSFFCWAMSILANWVSKFIILKLILWINSRGWNINMQVSFFLLWDMHLYWFQFWPLDGTTWVVTWSFNALLRHQLVRSWYLHQPETHGISLVSNGSLAQVIILTVILLAWVDQCDHHVKSFAL